MSSERSTLFIFSSLPYKIRICLKKLGINFIELVLVYFWCHTHAYIYIKILQNNSGVKLPKKMAPTKILVPIRCVASSVIHVSSATHAHSAGIGSIVCPRTSLGPKNLFESLGTG